MTCGIYKIENLINHKVYIGQSIEIERRFQKHINAKDDFIIHQAIRKYGKENFSFQIIEVCATDKLDEREQYWIHHFNSLLPNGYNMIEGGSNHVGIYKGKAVEQYTLSGDYLATFKSAQQASDETGTDHHSICDCCNEQMRYANGYQWKYVGTEKQIKPIEVRTDFTIQQLDKITNEVICEFQSLTDASNITGISKSTICSVCKGKGKTAGGYKWRYKNEPIEYQAQPRKTRTDYSALQRAVCQYDKQGNLIATYVSITEAAKAVGRGVSAISNALSGAAKTAAGFVWKYANN